MTWVSTWEELIKEWEKIWEKNPPEKKTISKHQVLSYQELIQVDRFIKETHEEPFAE